VLEPYRRKGRKDPIFFYRKVINKTPNEFLLNLAKNTGCIQ